MMTTDSERREVAERLRGDPCDTLIPYRTGIHFGMGCHEAANRFWDMCERIKSAGDYDIAHSTRSVLADLIDPDCEEGRYSVARTVRPVDREALLALVDEADKNAWYFVLDHDEDELRDRLDEAAEDFSEMARRIREACGVVA